MQIKKNSKSSEDAKVDCTLWQKKNLTTVNILWMYEITLVNRIAKRGALAGKVVSHNGMS